MSRTIAIGDIHGALKALIQLIQKVAPEKNDRLIFLGDYVDGWSESAATIAYLMELDKKFDCIFIKGNHDSWCESWLAGSPADKTWTLHGGKATIESYRHFTVQAKKAHLGFFNRMRNYYTDEQNRLFVHAGFASMRGPENERFESNFSWDRTLLEMAMSMDKNIKKDSTFYPRRLQLFREIYIGHTPTTNYNIDVPMQAANLWDVDTGAAFYGRISALDAATKSYWQSDPCYLLYPNESGRN